LIVATRMSLSFPLLFTAIPAYVRDLMTYSILRATGTPNPQVRKARIWFADGGISSNFPIHMFDALLPSRPTFALSLDELPKGSNEHGTRVIIPERARDGVGLQVYPMQGITQLASAILSSAKDWQDQLSSIMPGQRERIARVYLTTDEGGLNLSMPAARSGNLMKYGQTVGWSFANGALDFDDHRWRRSLVAYDQLEELVSRTGHRWNEGFDDWFGNYMKNPASYAIPMTDRRNVRRRLGAFADLAGAYAPPIKNKGRKFPRPRGRFRIVPDF
jgi:hypothetical protein